MPERRVLNSLVHNADMKSITPLNSSKTLTISVLQLKESPKKRYWMITYDRTGFKQRRVNIREDILKFYVVLQGCTCTLDMNTEVPKVSSQPS